MSGSTVRVVGLSVLVAAASVLGCGGGSTGTRKFVDWASENAIEIESLDLMVPTDDLAAVDPSGCGRLSVAVLWGT
jgi:hypothetical protein